ncbi:MAG: aminoacyl-histidine dipeptidase [Desulfobulbaceae bacterium]|nr:aminoacyl-histidine dipeptidase [Desulfobulbaceae bacterium]
MQEVIDKFIEISSIPRCSKREEKIREFMQQWAEGAGFPVKADKVGNLLITVPAGTGQQETPTIVLQGHLDMVCEKNQDSGHDFTKDPIKLVFDGDWLKADQTTLGADNGAGLAIAMFLAEDKTLIHPQLEILFTVDEETGLTGASALPAGFLSGKVLINLDSEDEGVFTIGCAGGRDSEIIFPLVYEKCPAASVHYEVKVHGLQGGHSGVNIGEQRANANVLLGRLLCRLQELPGVNIADVWGGSAHNAIPRESFAVIAAQGENVTELESLIAELQEEFREAYKNEPSLAITLRKKDEQLKKIISSGQAKRLVDLFLVAPDGVMALSKEVEGLVETSVNFATIRRENGKLKLLFSQRSDKAQSRDWLTARIESLARLAGAEVSSGNGYPGWQPDMDSDLLARAREVYGKLFGKEPLIEVIHAGLECGIIGAANEGMDMISIGPTIKNPHSPEEKLHLPSLGKVTQFARELIRSYCVQ